MNSRLTALWATKNKNDEWWSSFVTSPLAIAANYIVADWKWLTPNLLTLFSFITACVATALIVAGGTVPFILAAILIHASHVLDCMDGQMARYRSVTSRSGGFWDRITDQIQVILWFGAIGYAAYLQTNQITPIFLAFAGVAFYSLRGYVKYVIIFTETGDDIRYLERTSREVAELNDRREKTAGLGHGWKRNLQWFAGEQRKFLSFDEGVFIFMLSVGLVFDCLVPVLWIFAVSQTFYGLARSIQRGCQLDQRPARQVLTTTEK